MAFAKSSSSNSGFQIINETESIIHGSGEYNDSGTPKKRGQDGMESDSEGEKTSAVLLPGVPVKPGKKTRGRVKIEMKFIENKLRRYTTFSKRKTGIMKKVGLCMRVRVQSPACNTRSIVKEGAEPEAI